MWGLSSPHAGGTLGPCIARRILNHWTTRDVPTALVLGHFLGHCIKLLMSIKKKNILKYDSHTIIFTHLNVV